jgi:tRNA (cmo5U34)-methyltransferase
MNKENRDTVYVEPNDNVEAFRFDARVADVFENMIVRSVPGYALILDLIGLLTEKHAVSDSNCYDLGCSLGASTLMIRRNAPTSCHVVGVDNSAAMVERCRANMARDHSGASVEIREESLQDTTIENASVVVLNFTLQFVPVEQRSLVLKRIADGMVEGGVLVLAEKFSFDDPMEQAAMTELHLDFKRYHGYSDLEIAQKRAALENVLVPDTIETHFERLLLAGFSEAQLVQRCLNFGAVLAVK